MFAHFASSFSKKIQEYSKEFLEYLHITKTV